MNYTFEIVPTTDFRYIVSIYDNSNFIGKIALFQDRKNHNSDIYIDQIFYQDFSYDFLNFIMSFINANKNLIAKDEITTFKNIQENSLTSNRPEYSELAINEVPREALDGIFLPKNLILQQMRQLAEKRLSKLTNNLYSFHPIFEFTGDSLKEWYDALSLSEYPKSFLEFHKDKVNEDTKATKVSKYVASLYDKDSAESQDIAKSINPNKELIVDFLNNNETTIDTYYALISSYLNQERFKNEEIILDSSFLRLSQTLRSITIPTALKFAYSIHSNNFHFKYQEKLNNRILDADLKRMYELCFCYILYKSFHIIVEQILGTTTKDKDSNALPEENSIMLGVFNKIFLLADDKLELELNDIITRIISSIDPRLMPYASFINFDELRNLVNLSFEERTALLNTLENRTLGYTMYDSKLQENENSQRR